MYGRNKNDIKKHVVCGHMKSAAIHIWGAICGSQKSSLHIFKTTVTGISYVEALKNKMLPFAKRCRAKAFQQDDAPPHQSRFTKRFLMNQGVDVVPWPPYSPDLNPMEIMWAILKQKLSIKNTSTLEDLKDAVCSAWRTISPVTVHRLTKSFVRKIEKL